MSSLHLPQHFFLTAAPVRHSSGEQDLYVVAAEHRMRIGVFESRLQHELHRHHRQGHVTMPGGPLSGLIVRHADMALRVLKSPRCDKPLERLGVAYGVFGNEFGELFRSGNHSVVKTAQRYLCGLMQAQKQNMERMAEAVPDSDQQVLQNFLTHSYWDYRAVMDRVASKADALIGAEIGAGPYLDESAFQKKGDHSVGVARQWNGRLGNKTPPGWGVWCAGAVIAYSRACGTRSATVCTSRLLPAESSARACWYSRRKRNEVRGLADDRQCGRQVGCDSCPGAPN